jgi:hypothetical protein
VHLNERIHLGSDVELETQNQLPEESDEEEEEISTEQQVYDALNSLSSACDIRVELRPCDTIEEGLLATFVSVGCGCSKKCSSQFSLSYIRDMRAQCYNLSHNELDLVLLGQLVTSTNTSEKVVIESGYLERERSTELITMQARLCGKTFRFLQDLAKSLRENGLTPRTHGNAHKRPKHSLSFESTEFVVQFLLNYAEQNALLPGRVPGYSRSDIKLLPSSVSKRGIWKTYHSAADEETSIHAVAYTTFCRLWRSLLPSVVIMKPMTDLCWMCHQNSTAILRVQTALGTVSPPPSRKPRSTSASSRSRGASTRPLVMLAGRV